MKTLVLTLFLVSLLIISSCSKQTIADASGNFTMTPSVTYLYLLRHTPFFTELDTQQLRWVIGHSEEWKVQTGGVITTSQHETDYWILLDGGWRLSCDDKNHPSRHDEAGKWFNPSITNKQCELTATSPSHVMRIKSPVMHEMINRGFTFKHHLETGFPMEAEL
ncbi:MAG: hypothetical protein ACSHXJ_02180 [Marinomonas colpomeniae]